MTYISEPKFNDNKKVLKTKLSNRAVTCLQISQPNKTQILPEPKHDIPVHNKFTMT